MNSFWIPDLGGQIYAMPNMKTELYLMANSTGDFRGSSANISGEGFAGMHFIARASSEKEYHQWIALAQKSAGVLNWEEYKKLAAPSQNIPVELYQLKDEHMFNQVLMKYMHPQGNE
jgi:cytochrome o ubiquinol oxidase subunit 2